MRLGTCHYAQRSHPGLKRKRNEDRVHCDPAHGIFIVVDGMGGQAGGERAAEIAIERLRARLERPTGTPAERIREAITLANNEIHEQATGNPEWRGMACVLSVMLVEKGRVTIGHVGDTRVYHYSSGKLRKLTHDHSPVGIREEMCDLTEVEAMRHPRRNEVFRDVGSRQRTPGDEGFIDILEEEFRCGAALLMCSDGLTDLLTAARIQEIIKERAGRPVELVDRLIAAANDAGGDDNISVVWIENGRVGRRVIETVVSAVPRLQRLGFRRGGYLVTFLFGLILGGCLFGIGQYMAARHPTIHWIKPTMPLAGEPHQGGGETEASPSPSPEQSHTAEIGVK